MRSAKKYIRPIDMMIIYRAHRSVWRKLNQGKRVVDPNEARELSDEVIRKLVEVAREAVIDIDTLRERALAAFARAQVLQIPYPRSGKQEGVGSAGNPLTALKQIWA
jgi:hypothetical protein